MSGEVFLVLIRPISVAIWSFDRYFCRPKAGETIGQVIKFLLSLRCENVIRLRVHLIQARIGHVVDTQKQDGSGHRRFPGVGAPRHVGGLFDINRSLVISRGEGAEKSTVAQFR